MNVCVVVYARHSRARLISKGVCRSHLLPARIAKSDNQHNIKVYYKNYFPKIALIIVEPIFLSIPDFVVGTWIPLLVAPCGDYTWILAIIGFALFRIIDIFKPLGCRKIEQIMPGGWGVMFDDVLAGTYALIILFVIKSLGFQ